MSKHLSNLTEVHDAEWAAITPNKVVVATGERTWLHQHSGESDRFSRPMQGVGSKFLTRKLLDGAIAAAKIAVGTTSQPPVLSPIRWVWRLAASYHLCRPTQRLMEEAAQHFIEAERFSLADWAGQKALEEENHYRLALRDIYSMGYKAEEVVEKLIPPMAEALVNYFTKAVQDTDPIDCVGYSYTMERLALCVDRKYIQSVEELLPPGINATRCLRVHSNIGGDIEHVEETVEMVAGLTPQERTRIARSCYETALLCFSPPPSGYISDSELQQLLKPLKLSTCL